jgi:hypothetical protein
METVPFRDDAVHLQPVRLDAEVRLGDLLRIKVAREILKLLVGDLFCA